MGKTWEVQSPDTGCGMTVEKETQSRQARYGNSSVWSNATGFGYPWRRQCTIFTQHNWTSGWVAEVPEDESG